MNNFAVPIDMVQLAALLGMNGGLGAPDAPGLQNPHADLIDRLAGKTFHLGTATAMNRDDSITFYAVDIRGEPMSVGARLTSLHDSGRITQFQVQSVDFTAARPGSPRRVIVSFDMCADQEWCTYELSFVLGANDTVSGTTKMITPGRTRKFNLSGCLVVPEDLPNPPRRNRVEPAAPAAQANPVPAAAPEAAPNHDNGNN